jgi:hypothetical protein
MKRYVRKFLRDSGRIVNPGVSSEDRRRLGVIAFASWRHEVRKRPNYPTFAATQQRYPRIEQSNQTRANRVRHRMRAL